MMKGKSKLIVLVAIVLLPLVFFWRKLCRGKGYYMEDGRCIWTWRWSLSAGNVC